MTRKHRCRLQLAESEPVAYRLVPPKANDSNFNFHSPCCFPSPSFLSPSVLFPSLVFPIPPYLFPPQIQLARRSVERRKLPKRAPQTCYANAFLRIYGSQNAPRGSIFHLSSNISYEAKYVIPLQSLDAMLTEMLSRKPCYRRENCAVLL